MKVIQVKDYEALSKEAYSVIAETLQENPKAVINTTTGASYDGTFELLVKAINSGKVNIQESVFTNLDEYVAERNKSFTVFSYMHKNFYDLIDTKPRYVGLLDGSGSVTDLEKELERYKEVLNKYPRDLQIVGLGVNAHLAANEPGTPFDSRLFLADSDQSTIDSTMGYHNLSKEEAPTQMLTMGLADIMDSKHILVASSGKRKAQAVKETLEGPISEECPASILRTHPNVTFIMDEDAASLLEKKY
ncbi:glucosamine-6-phosphate deaminase [Oceanobacillus alkalisoli]|uniref:glucosamine-6-phosphate deaminase n=1 Tax=Oceanobacillus alkalisoli TaxID=2925113 RepID=UPI001EEFC68B|nr:glucosamine-6-phosphate deaminase [Oceanobacillus alkalisoli]MCF3944125.1 glucosamine-6-phosphate deaminase [Oceanobacillus alkalisoli]MCG5102534.1 glucosamine-6-phosphate deaminase [Oceanobacillus alkalisoli]